MDALTAAQTPVSPHYLFRKVSCGSLKRHSCRVFTRIADPHSVENRVENQLGVAKFVGVIATS
jgi:hypothetical protein